MRFFVLMTSRSRFELNDVLDINIVSRTDRFLMNAKTERSLPADLPGNRAEVS